MNSFSSSDIEGFCPKSLRIFNCTSHTNRGSMLYMKRVNPSGVALRSVLHFVEHRHRPGHYHGFCSQLNEHGNRDRLRLEKTLTLVASGPTSPHWDELLQLLIQNSVSLALGARPFDTKATVFPNRRKTIRMKKATETVYVPNSLSACHDYCISALRNAHSYTGKQQKLSYHAALTSRNFII